MEVYPFLPSFYQGVFITATGSLVYSLVCFIYNVYFHPLSRFPGPRGAACTGWWLAYMELGRGISLSTIRAELHRKYGDIVRISPNELHFARPTVYDEIYNSKNKWDKDYGLYRGFDMDESSLTQKDYLKAKHRRALYANKFSRKAISEAQPLVRKQLDRFCDALKRQNAAGKSSDLLFGFQCVSSDIIANLLFATCFNQMAFPDFQGDIVKGIDMCMPTFTMAKHSLLFLWIVRYFPPSFLMILAPTLKGLMVFRKTLEGQVKNVLRNPKLLGNASHRVVYAEILDSETNEGHSPPSALHLCHEGLALYTEGSYTVGITLMTGVYHILRNPEVKQRLVDEVHTAWPVLYDEAPSYEDLEKLPFMTAVIKEALRIAVPTPAGLTRVVPPSGATISGVEIPGGTVVSQSSVFVSLSEEIFARPHEFRPDRWLQPESKALDNWLVAFSKGPRSCLGINLSYCELYLTLAYMFRRFDVREDMTKPADLTWSEHFVPLFRGQHLHAYFVPRSE